MGTEIKTQEQFFDNILALHENTKEVKLIIEGRRRTELGFKINGTEYETVKFVDESKGGEYGYYTTVRHSGMWHRVPDEKLNGIFDLLYAIVTNEDIDYYGYSAGVGYGPGE